MKIGEAWSLHPLADERYRYIGFIYVQGRRVRVEIDFPEDFPFAEPRFRFPERNVTNPCIDEITGQMAPLWGPSWSPAASHPNVIMQSLIAALNAHDIKGKGKDVEQREVPVRAASSRSI